MRFIQLMNEGGWAMWFVLAFGTITLALAAGFAHRPDPRRLASVVAFTRATLFAVAAAVSVDLAAVGSKIPANPEWAKSPSVHLIVMEGIAESLAPAILGCSLCCVVWIVVAVGERRRLRELSPLDDARQ
jgi:hypothetical protein